METWIDSKDLLDSTWKIQYSQSFYFIMVTMITVGYGKIIYLKKILIVFYNLLFI
jgi:hypothetical protein